MSRIDKLPFFTVKVDGGSGCLFQPIDDSYSYVLTAKHVINENNTPSIIRQTINNNGQLINDTLEIIGIPFNHIDINKDAAIIKVKKVVEIESLLRDDPFSENRKDYYLCGHPKSRLNGEYSFRENKINIENKKQYGYVEAELTPPAIYSEIVGQSGGGIIKIEESCFLLAGIQKQMAEKDDNETLGRIEFMPLSFYDEIIAKNSQSLSPLCPPYIKSFEILINEIFPLSGIQIIEQKKALIQNELKVIAKGLCSDFTPKEILTLYNDSLLVSGTEKALLNHKELWVSFLELLSINQLHRENKLTIKDLENLHKSKRLYFTDSKEWITKLEDIYRSDLSEIEKGGFIIISSTNDTKPTTVEIDKDFIGDICRIPSIEMNISNTVEDPFNDLSIIHIYKFQKHIIDNYKAFSKITSANSKITLQNETKGVI